MIIEDLNYLTLTPRYPFQALRLSKGEAMRSFAVGSMNEDKIAL